MRRLLSVFLAGLVAIAAATRIGVLTPEAEPDFPEAHVWPFKAPPPPPSSPTRPPRPTGWRAPTWPASPATTRPLPDFAVTAFDFPNTREVIDFYWEAPAAEAAQAIVGAPNQLRQLSRDWASRLSASCPNEPVAAHLRDLATSTDPIVAPVLLHRASINGHVVWVVVAVWEYAAAGPGLALGHIRVHVLSPSSSAPVASESCA